MPAHWALNPFKFWCHVLPVARLFSSLLLPLLSSALVFVLTIAYSPFYLPSHSLSRSLLPVLPFSQSGSLFTIKAMIFLLNYTLAHKCKFARFFSKFSSFYETRTNCTYTNTTLPTVQRLHAQNLNLFSGYLD